MTSEVIDLTTGATGQNGKTAGNNAAIPLATHDFESTSGECKETRILHICTRFAHGGSEQRLYDMVAALPEHDHHVIVGAASEIEHARDRLPYTTVVVEPSLRRSVNLIADLAALKRLRHRVKEIDPAVIVTHQSKAGVLGRVAARLAGAYPVIHSLSMADFGPGYGPLESRLFRLIEHQLARWTTAYATVGQDLAESFSSIGVPAEKFRVIRSAARLPSPTQSHSEARSQVAQEFNLPIDRPWILYVGSLDDRKSVLDLPIMLQQAIQLTAGPPPHLVIAGSGSEEQRLSLRIDQVGIAGNCSMLGFVEDPRSLFTAADVVVLLSRAEGLPQVLIQAAASRTPFVSTSVDGVDELLELGATGTVVEHGDVVGATRAIVPYLRWPADRRGASIDLSSWSEDRVRAAYRELFADVLMESPRTKTGAVVAIIGSDGAGKSTLSQSLVESLQRERRVARIYFGSGDGPSSMLRWPLKKLKRIFLGKGDTGARRSLGETSGSPSLKIALLRASRVIWALVLAREKEAKLTRARRLANRGVLVICDRFPQSQIAGTTDGPLLSSWTESSGRVRRALGSWEARPYERANTDQPDLVLRLRVDQETAVQRRPSHDPSGLIERRQVVEDLCFDNAKFGVVEIDAGQNAEMVFSEARAAIQRTKDSWIDPDDR